MQEQTEDDAGADKERQFDTPDVDDHSNRIRDECPQTSKEVAVAETSSHTALTTRSATTEWRAP